MAVNVVSFSFSWCSTGGPGFDSAGCWLSLLHLISIFFGPQFNQGSRRPLRSTVAFPTTSLLSSLQLYCNCHSNCVLTELYNSSTSTWSLTRSLKSHVWSSSNGNNCHAVHRSLSSGASLCNGTVGPSPCPILSALIRPRDLFRLLAIGMGHFLPVRYLGMAFLAGSKAKIQQLYIYIYIHCFYLITTFSPSILLSFSTIFSFNLIPTIQNFFVSL